MLVVRKQGKAHDRYNSFRSAFELLESVGREPDDCFEEDENDLLPLQRLEIRMQQQMNDMQQEIQKHIGELKQETVMQRQQIDELKQENVALRSRLQKVESRDAEKNLNLKDLL